MALTPLQIIYGFVIILQILDNVKCIYVRGNPPAINRVWPSATTPVFEATLPSVTAAPGETAQLPCKVRNLGDKVVSWIRRHDLHIISYESYIFSGDSRFKVIHPMDDTDTWSLQIRNVKFDDDGLYECQVNTEPKMKQAIQLFISDKITRMEPELIEQKDDSAVYGTEGTMILGQKERYVKLGSSLTLTCHSRSIGIYQTNEQRPARLVEWLQNDKIIIFDHSRSGVNVDTEKDGRDLSSKLTLASVNLSDSGKYTCKPYNSEAYTISLIVVEGERTEAMQSDQSGGSNILSISLTVLFSALFITIL